MSSPEEYVNAPIILKNVTENVQVVEDNVGCTANQQTELCSFCQTPFRARTNSNEGKDNSHMQTAPSQSQINPPAQPPAPPQTPNQDAFQVKGKIEDYQRIDGPCSAPSGYSNNDCDEVVGDGMVSPVADGLVTSSVARPGVDTVAESGAEGVVTGGSVTGGFTGGQQITQAKRFETSGHLLANSHIRTQIQESTVVLRTPGQKLGASLKMSRKGWWRVHAFKENCLSFGKLSGVQIGDRLSAIDGSPPSDKDSLEAALQVRRPCTLVFQRRVQISIRINEEQKSPPPFDDMLCSAWCVCCFCNCCCGACAIDEAARARDAYQAGNLVEAERSNAAARKYIAAAICSGAVVVLLWFILFAA